MRLKQGDLAIDFTTVDIFGKAVKLSDYKGKKIFLTFFRNVSCPYCNSRVHELMGNMVRLQGSGMEVILLFESSAEKLKASVLHKGLLPWKLIGDPKKVIYNTYGVENSVLKMLKTVFVKPIKKVSEFAKTLPSTGEKDTDSSNTLIPADFLIDENFIIQKAAYGKDLGDHIDIEEVAKFAGLYN